MQSMLFNKPLQRFLTKLPLARFAKMGTEKNVLLLSKLAGNLKFLQGKMLSTTDHFSGMKVDTSDEVVSCFGKPDAVFSNFNREVMSLLLNKELFDSKLISHSAKKRARKYIW